MSALMPSHMLFLFLSFTFSCRPFNSVTLGLWPYVCPYLTLFITRSHEINSFFPLLFTRCVSIHRNKNKLLFFWIILPPHLFLSLCVSFLLLLINLRSTKALKPKEFGCRFFFSHGVINPSLFLLPPLPAFPQCIHAGLLCDSSSFPHFSSYKQWLLGDDWKSASTNSVLRLPWWLANVNTH